MNNRRILCAAVVILLTVTIVGVGGVAGDVSSERVGATLQESDVSVSEVSIDSTTVQPGETVEIEGIVENTADDTREVDLSLEVDGETVETETVSVHPQFPVIAQFEWTPEEPGSYQLSINGADATEEFVVEADDSETEENGEQDQNGEDAENGEPDDEQFSVLEVEIEEPEIAVGETTQVIADIGNDGDQSGDYEVTLEKDGEAVETQTVEQIQPELDVGAQAFFDLEPDEEGTYTVSVNGVEAEQQLVVGGEEDDDGGLFSFLGFLPLGIIRLVGLFVVLPLLLIYLALKALAIYLGY